ncbi:MAG TPA: acyl-CoA thioesterase domain-containing protein [Candidatus Limnocylindria bacterium]|nr:acyl-CoA thioesterase domain-containing protein [Candidatus Limnocylindria bacterium]
MDAAAAGRRLVDGLLRRLDLRAAGADRFTGTMPRGEGFVFGGLLLAQGLVAAGRTIEGTPHALHAHFLRGGRYGVEIDWQVTRLRDGMNFATRRVDGSQAGRLVVTLTLSFLRRAGDGLAHQDAMPAVAAPEGLEDWEDLRVRILNDPGARRPDGPLEVRDADPDEAAPALGRAARRRLWLRPRAPLPDDPLVHAAVLAFASDRGLLSTAARPHGIMWGARQGASLDHALWLHAPARFDDWLLYASESPVAVAGRGLVLGALYARDGRRIASSAQEGLIRVRR